MYYVDLFLLSAVVFRFFNVFFRVFKMFLVSLATVVRLCFTSDTVLLIDWLFCIDLFSCIAASVFNKLTYLLTYRWKDCCSRNVFKWRLNDCNVEAETVCSGIEFQVWAAATGKARLPTVASLTGGTGTTRRLVPAERRALRPGTSTVEVSGPRYRGALPWRNHVQWGSISAKTLVLNQSSV